MHLVLPCLYSCLQEPCDLFVILTNLTIRSLSSPFSLGRESFDCLRCLNKKGTRPYMVNLLRDPRDVHLNCSSRGLRYDVPDSFRYRGSRNIFILIHFSLKSQILFFIILCLITNPLTFVVKVIGPAVFLVDLVSNRLAIFVIDRFPLGVPA